MTTSSSRFPAGLLDWAGHRAGGVRRLFHEQSGRPSGVVIRTHLLDRLEGWAKLVGKADALAPRVVLLVGGPGNGKTEAVEFAIRKLDEAVGANGNLSTAFYEIFNPKDASAPPRIANFTYGSSAADGSHFDLSIVQDASAADAKRPGASPAELLVQELEEILRPDSRGLYLACVNRGILDDALIIATDQNRREAGSALLAIVQAIGAGPVKAACWPLHGFSQVAVWPMDVETLLAKAEATSSGGQLLTTAIMASSWPVLGSCPAGTMCPFCYSRDRLAVEPNQSSLLKVLRWFELASGKRWSFRDLASLVSHLLAGMRTHPGAPDTGDPCTWAAGVLGASGPERLRLAAPFLLVAAQYQHALFGGWPHFRARQLRRDVHQLGLERDPVFLGFYLFLDTPARTSMPPTLAAQLVALADTLDPAAADPDTTAAISESSQVSFRELDVRFSQSIEEGRRYILKGARRNWFSPMECRLLEQLAEAEERLALLDATRRYPAAAFRVQRLLRSFACSLIRRSIGVRTAAVKDAELLSEYEQVVAGDRNLLHSSVRQVQALLNEQDRFRVCLNTTFGEPLPPAERQAVLVTAPQRVRPLDQQCAERPQPAFPYLAIGSGPRSQAVPLTYELFKAAAEMRRGMLPASLPRPVVALLDTTRARLAGQLVRDNELLEDGEIRIGRRADTIVMEQGEFLIRQENKQ